MLETLLVALLSLTPLTSMLPKGSVVYDQGPLSMYYPGDGMNSGELACGGQFTHEQVHIAYRGWRRVGCGRHVLVCSKATGRCVLATVQDAGPFGVYRGPLKNAYREGRWKVHTASLIPPKGWRYRAAVDLSVGLWKKLGRPSGMTHVRMIFLPAGLVSAAKQFLRARAPAPEV